MRQPFGIHGIYVLLALSALSLAGCSSSQPSRFYVLHSAMAPGTAHPVPTGGPQISLGIGPVKLPEYLDRPQIVTRTTRSKIELAEFDRWAEPLQDNFARVLGENLSAALATDRVVFYPWPKTTPVDYQIAVEVTQFEGAPGGKVTLGARWTIYGEQGKKVIAMRQSSILESVEAAGYEALVTTQSRALSSLSREIAAFIEEISPGAHGRQ